MSKSSTTTDAMALEGMRRPPTHPGALLAEMLADHGVSLAEAARRIGVTRGMLSQVCTGRRPMPAALCVKLAALLGTSVEFWGQLQMRHDLWHALQDRAVKAAVRQIVPVPRDPSVNAPQA